MAFLYKPIRYELRKVFDNFRSIYDDDHPSLKQIMDINTKRLYTRKEIDELFKTREWLYFSTEESCFESCCGWCHERRFDCPADDNEHNECDLRLHYHSEEGILEQEKTLIDLKPELPSVVVDHIIQFLLP